MCGPGHETCIFQRQLLIFKATYYDFEIQQLILIRNSPIYINVAVDIAENFIIFNFSFQVQKKLNKEI